MILRKNTASMIFPLRRRILFVALFVVAYWGGLAYAAGNSGGFEPNSDSRSTRFPPPAFYEGKYEIVGRTPDGKTYNGWARIKVASERWALERCVNGSRSKGQLSRTTVTADRLPALLAEFELFGEPFFATCTEAVDFNNYPRITCHTYPKEKPNVGVPGLESWFPIQWRVPSNFYECAE